MCGNIEESGLRFRIYRFLYTNNDDHMNEMIINLIVKSIERYAEIKTIETDDYSDRNSFDLCCNHNDIRINLCYVVIHDSDTAMVHVFGGNFRDSHLSIDDQVFRINKSDPDLILKIQQILINCIKITRKALE